MRNRFLGCVLVCTIPGSIGTVAMPSLKDCNGANHLAAQLDLLTDSYPQDTSWHISVMHAGGESQVGNGSAYNDAFRTFQYNYCLPINDCYIFEIIDEYGDGFYYKDEGNAGYNFTVDGTVLSTSYDDMNGSFGYNESIIIGNCQVAANEFEYDAGLPFAVLPEEESIECSQSTVELHLYTDSYPEDLSWYLSKIDSHDLIDNVARYTDKFKRFQYQYCLQIDDCYKFEIIDSFGDGIGYYDDKGRETGYNFTLDGVILSSSYDDKRGWFGHGESVLFGTKCPTQKPSIEPSIHPSMAPSFNPTLSVNPTNTPSSKPSSLPSFEPSRTLTTIPSLKPSSVPSSKPNSKPSETPSVLPSLEPSNIPSLNPSFNPSFKRTAKPSIVPSVEPSIDPSINPSYYPSLFPSLKPSVVSSVKPSLEPSALPSLHPSLGPSLNPSVVPSVKPSAEPSPTPSHYPSSTPSFKPSVVPSKNPSFNPSLKPSFNPSLKPSTTPSTSPSSYPSLTPSFKPSVVPSSKPSLEPSTLPSLNPSLEPSLNPSVVPSVKPSAEPSPTPSHYPSSTPSFKPSVVPSNNPSFNPSSFPSITPSHKPSMRPSGTPTPPLVCQNDPSFTFKRQNSSERTKTCHDLYWVSAETKKKFCKWKKVKFRCSIACNTNDCCGDNELFLYKKGGHITCNSVSSLPPEERKTTCDLVNVRKNCPKACNQCS